MRLKHCHWISKDDTHLWPSSDYFPDAVYASSTANSCRVCSITLSVQGEMAAWGLRKLCCPRTRISTSPGITSGPSYQSHPFPSTCHNNAKAIPHLLSTIQLLLYGHTTHDKLRTGGNIRLWTIKLKLSLLVYWSKHHHNKSKTKIREQSDFSDKQESKYCINFNQIPQWKKKSSLKRKREACLLLKNTTI